MGNFDITKKNCLLKDISVFLHLIIFFVNHGRSDIIH